MKARLEAPAPDIQTIRPDLKPEIAAVISRMLQREPSLRYPTYVSLLADMRKILATDDAAGKTAAQPKKRGKIVLTKTRTLKIGAAGPAAAGAAAPVAPAAEAVVPKKPKGRKLFTPVRLVIGAVAALLIVGGSVGGCVHHNKRLARERAAEAESAALASAVQAVAVAADVIEAAATNQQAVLSATRAFFDATTNALTAAAATTAASPGAMAALDSLPGLDSVQDVASNALDVVSTIASDLDQRLQQAREKKAAAGQEKTSKAVLAIVADVTALSTNLEAKARIAQQVRSEAEQASRQAARISDKLSQIKTAEAAAAAAKATAKAEVDRKAAEAAAAKAAAAAEETLKEQERTSVQSAHDSNLEKIKANQYSEALAAIVAAVGDLKTAEGKAELQIVKSRLTLLMDLKAFLVKQLATGYRWGWLTPAGDVKGSDENNVMITGKSVPWNEVSAAQMMKFIRHYLDDESLLQRKERARMYLATAVFCYENGAVKPAAGFAARAADLNSDLKDEADRIMPAPVEKKTEP